MSKVLSLSTAILLAWSMTAAAQITYVDADHTTNTAPASGTPTFPVGAIDDQGANDDGLWGLRAFSNGGTIYQNAGFGGSDDAHRLVTTISGLASGPSYNVYAYFWSDGSGWNINAGLFDDAMLPFYDDAGTPAASDLDFASPAPIVTEGNRTLYQAFLGQTVADSSGAIPVYIDDDPPVLVSGGPRTWYDGVGYELVPEPTSIALLMLGVSVGGFVRKR